MPREYELESSPRRVIIDPTGADYIALYDLNRGAEVAGYTSLTDITEAVLGLTNPVGDRMVATTGTSGALTETEIVIASSNTLTGIQSLTTSHAAIETAAISSATVQVLATSDATVSGILNVNSPNAESSSINVVGDSVGDAISILGRAADGLGSLSFYGNNGTTRYGRILCLPTEMRLSPDPVTAVLTLYTNSAKRFQFDASGNGIFYGPSTSFAATPTAGGVELLKIDGTNGPVLGSDADWDIWFSSGATMARLGIGTSNQYLFVSNGTLGWTSVATGGVSDHGALTGLTDDDHTQYALTSNAAEGPGYTPNRIGEIYVDTSNGNIYIAADTSASSDFISVGATSAATDHGTLTGLADDDHTQYTLADGTRAFSYAGMAAYDIWFSSSGTLGVLPIGTSNQHLFVSNGTLGWTSVATASGGYTLGTLAASTTGTSVEFTGIPAGTKHIMISLNAVSLNGTNNIWFQLGDSGGFETTGYVGTGTYTGTASAGATTTSGFLLYTATATNQVSGILQLTLMDASTFLWAASGVFSLNGSTYTFQTAGSKALSAELDRVRLISSGGNSFDNGSVNIMYS